MYVCDTFWLTKSCWRDASASQNRGSISSCPQIHDICRCYPFSFFIKSNFKMFAMWDRRECSCWIIIATQRCTSERNIWWVVDEVGSLTDYPWRNYMKRCLRMYDAFIICVLNLNQFCMKFRKQFCEKPVSITCAIVKSIFCLIPLKKLIRMGCVITFYWFS